MVFFPSFSYASKPLLGIIGVEINSPKVVKVAKILEFHLINIFNSTGIFDGINPSLLKDELTKFDCLEDSCLLRFARTAGLNLLVRGLMEDRGDSIVIDLYAIGIDTPYFGRVIHRYRVVIPVSGLALSMREYGFICEEHAGYFISEMLQKYHVPLQVMKNGEGNITIESENIVNGLYDLYRYESKSLNDNLRIHRRIGNVRINNNRFEIIEPKDLNIENGDFILFLYNEKAELLDEFCYGRKKEIVFDDISYSDSLFMILFSAPSSALMPVFAPFGYYGADDYTGLFLWAVNAIPYLYYEYKGLNNRPSEYREKKRNVSKAIVTRYYFGISMLLFGGTSLFVDAFSHQHLNNASNYQGKYPLMGNNLSVAYLSLIGGGGGHFFRGYRYWGYFYFHIDNILLYFTLREFAKGERYDVDSDSYKKQNRINKTRGYALIGLLGIVRIIEITHSLLLRDNIRNGRITDTDFVFEPHLCPDSEDGFVIGAKYTYKF